MPLRLGSGPTAASDARPTDGIPPNRLFVDPGIVSVPMDTGPKVGFRSRPLSNGLGPRARTASPHAGTTADHCFFSRSPSCPWKSASVLDPAGVGRVSRFATFGSLEGSLSPLASRESTVSCTCPAESPLVGLLRQHRFHQPPVHGALCWHSSLSGRRPMSCNFYHSSLLRN